MKKLVALFVVCFAVPAIAFALSASGHDVPELGNLALLSIGVMGLGLARHRVRANR